MTEEIQQEEVKEVTEETISQETETSAKKDSAQRSDLFAIVILLAGLLAGSIFVDVAQLVTGQGFSKSALRKADVFETDGKTWVAYKEPAVHLSVLTNEKCEKCNPDDALLFLRQYIPTLLAKKVDIASEEGKKIAQSIDAKTLPAFVFDANLEKTDVYAQAQQVLEKKGDAYVLNTQAMGVPVGEYLEAPSVGESDIVLGKKDATVRVVEYCDFSAPQCKLMQASADRIVREYGEKIVFDFKPVYAPANTQSENAALATMCANEQGKFSEYASAIFGGQAQWTKSTGTTLFEQYARNIRLNTTAFNACLKDKKYANALKNVQAEAQQFGIADVPTFFVGTEFVSGAAQYDTLKQMIDKKLGNASDQNATPSDSASETTDQSKPAEENAAEQNKA